MKRVLNKYEAWYMEQLSYILEEGSERTDRTGTGVFSVPNLHYTHDLRISHPLMSSRFFDPHKPITEMIWMMSGSSNIGYLKENKCPFWNGFAVKEGQDTPTALDRIERLKLLAQQRGVPYGKVIAMMANEPVDAIDEELDRQQVPNMVNAAVGKVGELGPVYGVQWRHWPNPDGTTFDQLVYALDTLRDDPNSRRVVVNCWNPSFMPTPSISPADNAAKGNMALTPCHFAFGFYTKEIPWYERAEMMKKVISPEKWMTVYPVRDAESRIKIEAMCDMANIPKHYLDINFTMRSNDWILGQPANMNMYSALLMMFAQQLNMTARFVNYTGWDSHIYSNHLPGIEKLVTEWKTGDHKYGAPKVTLGNKPETLFDYHHTDFIVSDYHPKEHIKFPIAI